MQHKGRKFTKFTLRSERSRFPRWMRERNAGSMRVGRKAEGSVIVRTQAHPIAVGQPKERRARPVPLLFGSCYPARMATQMQVRRHELMLERVRSHAAAIREIVERHGASNPRVIGSVARGEEQEGSDVDILVDNVRLTLFRLVDMQDDLAALLGKPVDVVVDEEIPVRARSRILREALSL